MVSVVVESDKELTSLEKEDVFIANTIKLAKLVFEIHHEQKVIETYPPEGSITAKGAGPSRPEVEQTSPAVREEVREDDSQRAAAEYVGRRLREMAGANEPTLTRAFDGYIRRSIWDMNYETFQEVMRDVVNSQQNNMNKVLWTFAGFLHISNAVRETDNDVSLQNEYLDKFARFVGRFINDQGLMSWVEQQGGWERIGTAV